MTQVVTTTRPAMPPVRIQLAVAAWLDEHRARVLTHGADDAEMGRFRAALQRVDLDRPSGAGAVGRWGSQRSTSNGISCS